MAMKKNLERAIILGLILSTGVYGTAWAEDFNNIIDDNDNLQLREPVYGLNGDEYHFEILEDSYYNSEKLFDVINVTVKNNYYHMGGDAGDWAVGISTIDRDGLINKANVSLNAINNINVNVQTRNAQNAYGLLADDDGKYITLNSQEGNIVIDVSKTKGIKSWISAVDPDSVNYEKAEVHAISAENNGTANLTAENGNILISVGYDLTDANAIETEKLQQGNIYGIGNSKGTIDLSANGNTDGVGAIQVEAKAHTGNAYGLNSLQAVKNNLQANKVISISAISETGNAYAVKVNADNSEAGINNKFESTYNEFTANSASGEEAYAIKAENGTKIDVVSTAGDNVIGNWFESNKTAVELTEGSVLNADGNTVIKGAENGLVVVGNGGNGTSTLAEGEENYQVNINGDLYAYAQENEQDSSALDVSNGGSVNVTGNGIVNNDVIVKDNSKLNIGKDMIAVANEEGHSTIEGTALTVTNKSIVDVGGNLYLKATDTGLDVNNSTITVSGNEVNIVEGNIGINAVYSTLNLTGNTIIKSTANGMIVDGNVGGSEPNVTVNGNLILSSEGDALNLKNGANMKVYGDQIFDNTILIEKNAKEEVTGNLISNGIIEGDAVNLKQNAELTIGGNISVGATGIGLNVEDSKIIVNGQGNGQGFNDIISDTNVINASDSTIKLNAGEKGINTIISRESFDEYGVHYTGIAVNATNDDDNTDSRNGSTVDILGAENNIGGAINAAGAQTTVNLAGSLDAGGTAVTGANNWISSAAVIKNAGDLESSYDEDMRKLKVVSALYAEDGATINLSGINNIQTYYKNPSDDTTSERVVWAYDKANINIDGYTFISTSKYENSPEDKDIAIAAGTATNLNDDSFDNYPAEADWANVNVTYNNYGEEKSSITGDILAAYAGNVDIKAAENSDAGINVLGDLLSGNGGKLSVDFGNGGTWTGRGDSYIDAGTQQDYESHQSFYSPAFSSDIITGGDIEVTMKNGTWNVTGQSWLNTFNATDTDIYMTDEDNVTNAVTINKMTGNGNTFHMNLDNDKRMDSDMLYIKESGEEGATFDVEVSGVINGLSDVTEENGLRFATVGNGVNLAQITLDGYGVIKGVDGGAFNTNLYVKREAYDVNNAHNDEFNGEELTADKPGSSTVEDMFGLTEDEEKQPEIMILAAEIPSENDSTVNSLADNLSIVKATQDGLSDAGKTMLNMSRANYSNAIYMDRLNKRLGEARYINAEDGEGMWVRIRHDRIGKTDAYRSQNTMYELGYDVKQECDNGERRVGMAVDYMHGDTGYSDIAGKGEIDRYGLWLYDTWMGNKGHYVDYVAKWGHLSNDFELYTMSRGEKVTGDYSNNVFSISAEYGRKKDLGGDWYIEPQAQLQLARVSGAEYNTSQHTEVSVDGINSLIGRAGFRLGKDFGKDKRSTVYIKADVLHEFLGDQDIYVRDETTNGHWAGISYENEGTWYDVGFGFATAVGKNSYAFMDFEKSFGHDNDETYQINVGMQWSF